MSEQPEVVNKPSDQGTPAPQGSGEPSGTPATQSGDKTDPNLLLKSLQEEREKRRELEDKQAELEEQINQLRQSPTSSEYDDGNLKGELATVRSELSDVKSSLAKREVLESNPVLKDKWAEFEEFRNKPDNKGLNLKTAAKAFLIEHDLIDPPRKGLEKTTGGQPAAPNTGKMSSEDAKKLRETNYREYRKRLEKGDIEIE